jgi:hypothetical protein
MYEITRGIEEISGKGMGSSAIVQKHVGAYSTM